MGIYYSYNVVGVKKLEKLGEDVDGDPILFCELQCVDEDGFELAPTRAVVVVGENEAQIERYVENLIPDVDAGTTDALWDKYLPYCEQSPLYDVYNTDELAAMLRD